MAWPDAERYRRHRSGKKVFAAELGVSERDHVIASDRGRGAFARLTAEAIAQAAIALRLIDSGCEVGKAYRIGAAFSYQGEIRGPHLTTLDADIDPARDRDAGKLFSRGQTLLVYSPELGLLPGQESFRIVSTDDPSIPQGDAAMVCGVVLNLAGGDDDSAPRVIINLSSLCRTIANSLGASPSRLFGGSVKHGA